MLAHLTELSFHTLDQQVNVLTHLLDGLDIVTVFVVDLLFELFDELDFIKDDLGTGSFLSFDILYNREKKQKSLEKRYLFTFMAKYSVHAIR